MSIAICIWQKLMSPEHGRKLRQHLTDIAAIAFDKELENKAYCWYEKTSDSILEGEWIGGIELYDNERALVETHRSSPEYQAMRKAAAEESLWGTQYPEIVFMKALIPEASISKGSSQGWNEADSFVLISRFTGHAASFHKLVDGIRQLTKASWEESEVLSFYPMKKSGASDVVVIYERHRHERGFKKVHEAQRSLRQNLVQLASDSIITTWTKPIGFVGW